MGSKRSPLVRWLRRGATVLVSIAVLDYLVLPQIAGTREAVRLLDGLEPWLVVIGVALEGASLVSYSLLTRSVLPDNRSPFSWLLRADLTGLGVSHLLPGGAATASALRYRLLHEGGAAAEDAAVGIAVQGVGSTVVLAGLLWVALVASAVLLGLHPVYVLAAVVGAVVIAVVLGLIYQHSRRPAAAARIMPAVLRRLPAPIRPRIGRAVEKASRQLGQLLATDDALRAFFLWAVCNWLFDAASLWVFLAAYGERANPLALFVAYGVANLVAVLPISPGGLGVIEGVLIPSLVGFGTPSATAVLGVVSWRLFEFWAPIPQAGVCYASIRSQRWWRTHLATGT